MIDLGFVPSHKEKKGKFSVEEFDNILTVNGQTAVEVDLDSLDEKPWKKPGADITDYFNYGFTEETWSAYSNRQRRMRVNESGVGLALTGQTPILSNPVKLVSLGAGVGGTGTIPTLGAAPVSLGTSGAPPQSLGKIMSGPPPISLGPPPSLGAPSISSIKKDEPSSIAVMTHEKRIYSNKVNTSYSVKNLIGEVLTKYLLFVKPSRQVQATLCAECVPNSFRTECCLYLTCPSAHISESLVIINLYYPEL